MSTPVFEHHRSSPLVVQTVPRNQGRADVPALALNDAGHGSGSETNPILFGLGMTLNFEFNSHVRSFTVTVVRDGVSEDITGSLERVIADSNEDTGVSVRYKLPGRAGVFPLALSTDAASDFVTAQDIEFVVSMTNIAITRTSTSVIKVIDASDMRHCPVADDCDFALFGPLNKAGIRIFDHMGDRDHTDNSPVSFFFTQLDLLVALAPDTFALLTNYDVDYTVGIEFTNDGEACGPVLTGDALGCGSISCCCQIDGRNSTVSPVSGSTVSLTPFTVTITIPTKGDSGCVGWSALEVLLPGADNTAGWFEYDDTQVATLTANGVPVAINATSGLGHLNSRLMVAQVPIACGGDLVITFDLIGTAATTAGPVSAGFLTFSDPGACNPEDVGILLPDYSAAGTGKPTDPPPNIPVQHASESPIRVISIASWEVV